MCGVSEGEAWVVNYAPRDALAWATGNLRLRDWVVSIIEEPSLKARILREYDAVREKAVVRERDRYETLSERLRTAVERLNAGERTYLVGIIGELKAPGLRLGTARHRLTPSLRFLSNDFIFLPIMSGGSIRVSSRAVVRVGRDRFNNEVELDLDALPNGHGL